MELFEEPCRKSMPESRLPKPRLLVHRSSGASCLACGAGLEPSAPWMYIPASTWLAISRVGMPTSGQDAMAPSVPAGIGLGLGLGGRVG